MKKFKILYIFGRDGIENTVEVIAVDIIMAAITFMSHAINQEEILSITKIN